MMSQAIPQLGPFPMPASFRPCLPNQALLIRAGLREWSRKAAWPARPAACRLAGPVVPRPLRGRRPGAGGHLRGGRVPVATDRQEAGGGRRLAHAGDGKLPEAPDGPRVPPLPPRRLPLALAGLAPVAGAMGLARFGALPADGAEAGRPDRKAAFGRSPPCVPGTGSGMAHRVDANSREGARGAGRARLPPWLPALLGRAGQGAGIALAPAPHGLLARRRGLPSPGAWRPARALRGRRPAPCAPGGRRRMRGARGRACPGRRPRQRSAPSFIQTALAEAGPRLGPARRPASAPPK